MLDQFEELFTLGKNHLGKNAVTDKLNWLLENQLPAPLKECVLKGGKEARDFLFPTTPPDVRIIISLREDYLPHLTGLKSRVSSIDRNMFRVIHLNGAQAREIVNMPGGFRGEDLTNDILRSFYPEGVTENETLPDDKLEIDPVFLSLLCRQLYEKGKFKFVTREDRDNVIEDFYDSEVREFSGKVKKFIESRLLTAGGFRTPYRIAPDEPLTGAISSLENRRILRRFHEGEKQYIEIIHDVLAPTIKEKRRSRRSKNVIIAGLFVLILVLAGFTWYALSQKNEAEKQYRSAQANM